MSLQRAVFTGWLAGDPLISVYDTSPTTPQWLERTLTTAGWHDAGSLPNGSSPVTDGGAIANVVDPSTGNAIAVTDRNGATKTIELPPARWFATWAGNHGLTVLAPGQGFLLVGAPAIVTLDDQGSLKSSEVPVGYVALAPTSDARTFLLATLADAEEAGGLSASTPFSVYLWTAGAKTPPVLVTRQVVGVATSSVGLSWLRRDDGSWWSISSAGRLDRHSPPQAADSVISPDGSALVRLAYSATGCVQESTDPCPVMLIDSTGSSHPFQGPASGVSFNGSDVGILLMGRPALGLPWRLVTGAPDHPQTIPVS